MVLTRMQSTWYKTNSSFRETINKFLDCNIKKTLRFLNEKIKNSKPTGNQFYLIKPA